MPENVFRQPFSRHSTYVRERFSDEMSFLIDQVKDVVL